MANGLPTPKFGPDILISLLALTRKATPTPAAVTTALGELYPAGDGPTVADLLAGGWLVPTIDKKRLREPPMHIEEQKQRLEAARTLDPVACFSYFRGGITTKKPHAALTPAGLYAELISPRRKPQTEALRAATKDSPQREELKKRLDYVTPAGIFKHRANAELVSPSGLIVLDFDHLHNIPAARAALLADKILAPELVLLFTSPSGDGLKVLAKTDPTALHLHTFRAYADYLTAHYARLGLIPDPSGKDVARACFVPYAPDAWLTPQFK